MKRHSSRARKANSYIEIRDTFEQSICFSKELHTRVILEEGKITKISSDFNFLSEILRCSRTIFHFFCFFFKMIQEIEIN